MPSARQLLHGLLLRRAKRLPTHSVRSASHAQLGTRRLLARPMTARTGFADFVRMLGLLAAIIGCSGKATGSSAPAEVSPEDAGRPEKGTLCPPAVAGGAPAQCQTEETECCCGSECCSGVCFDGLCAAPCGGFGARCERAESTPANGCCSTGTASARPPRAVRPQVAQLAVARTVAQAGSSTLRFEDTMLSWRGANGRTRCGLNGNDDG